MQRIGLVGSRVEVYIGRGCAGVARCKGQGMRMCVLHGVVGGVMQALNCRGDCVSRFRWGCAEV